MDTSKESIFFPLYFTSFCKFLLEVYIVIIFLLSRKIKKFRRGLDIMREICIFLCLSLSVHLSLFLSTSLSPSLSLSISFSLSTLALSLFLRSILSSFSLSLFITMSLSFSLFVSLSHSSPLYRSCSIHLTPPSSPLSLYIDICACVLSL